MSTVDRVRQIREEAQAAVREQALMIEDVAVTPAGKRRLVRICVDRDLSDLAAGDDHSRVAAVTLDEVADATRAVSAALDESDAMGAAPYVLEVSSPGVDRPLTEPRHFRRNVTRLVALTRRDGAEVEGRLQAAGPDTITVAVQDGSTTPGPHLQIPYADIARARVQVEFARGTDEEDH